MNKRRVVITGVGIIAPNGIGKEAFWKANREGRSGVGKVTRFDVTELDSRIAGQVDDFDPAQYMAPEIVKKTDRFVHFGLAATELALKDSGADMAAQDADRVGVIIGSGLGGVLFHEEQLAAGYERGAHRLHPLSVPKITPNAVASHIAIRYGLRGPNMVVSTACASGSHAVGEAFRKVQYGEVDMCLTGGVEAPLSRFGLGAYCSLRVLSKRNDAPCEASRPFDRERDGFVLSEGAGIVVLEELEHALRRNAPVYAELTGYACNSGAHHMVMPDPDGQDAQRAMARAVADAGVLPEEVDYINAHATSTQANDRAETKAIKEVFGEHASRIPVSSTKSMIGHSLGAAGGIETVVCALAVESGFIPPTINYRNSDPECDLDYVPNEGRSSRLKTVLSNSFGFGNCNACLVFSKFAKG